MPPGTGEITDVAYTVQAGDPDPLIHTASVSCRPIGFPDVLTASSSWTVHLFQSSVRVTKTGPALRGSAARRTADVPASPTIQGNIIPQNGVPESSAGGISLRGSRGASDFASHGPLDR